MRQHRKTPLSQFRQKGTFYKPLLEMFLCYGQEEFFECRDEQLHPGNPLNFADMLEQKTRRNTVLAFKREEMLLQAQKQS